MQAVLRSFRPVSEWPEDFNQSTETISALQTFLWSKRWSQRTRPQQMFCCTAMQKVSHQSLSGDGDASVNAWAAG